jgi:transcriptional regulator with XRE-family HTH domain
MLLRHAIGAVLRRRRTQLGKTLRQLAEESRVSLPYLSEIERGRKEASSEILATVCRVLNLSLAEFLGEVSAEFSGATTAPVLELRSVREDLPASAPVRSSQPTAMLLAA